MQDLLPLIKFEDNQHAFTTVNLTAIITYIVFEVWSLVQKYYIVVIGLLKVGQGLVNSFCGPFLDLGLVCLRLSS